MKIRSVKLVSFLLVFILLISTTSMAVTVTQPTENLPEINNVIIMIPDGMSEDCVTLTRWYQGGTPLALDEMTSGLVSTYWAAGPITDSAPAGTAFATGHKSTSGYLGVNPSAVTMPGVPAVAAADAKKPLVNVLEAARMEGKATGIIATSNVQHATPASFSTHYPDRNSTANLAEQEVYAGLDVVLGGGSQYLTNRADKEDMIAEINKLGYQYVTGRESMFSIKSGKIWGMFAPDAMAYEMDRAASVTSLEPSLADMTSKAIELLSQNSKGFVLMVEGSKVDWAAHANDPVGVVSDVLAFDKAVSVALDFAKKDQHTMVLAMSDHGNGGISIGASTLNSGYDKAELSKFIDPLKKATLTGEGVEKKLNADRSNIVEVMAQYYGITDLTAEEIKTIKDAKAALNGIIGPMISKRANIGWTTTGHTGEEVVLYSYLPGNERVTGLIDNTDVAKLTAETMGVDLDALTAKTFIDTASVFTARGFSFVLDKSNANQVRLFADRGLQTIVLDQNKNYATINGKKVAFDSLIVYNGEKFFVPQKLIEMVAPTGDAAIKPLIESVGGTVTWIPEEQAISFTIGGSNGKLYIGSDVMELNGSLITIAKAPDFVNGRFAVSEAVADFIMSLK